LSAPGTFLLYIAIGSSIGSQHRITIRYNSARQTRTDPYPRATPAPMPSGRRRQLRAIAAAAADRPSIGDRDRHRGRTPRTASTGTPPPHPLSRARPRFRADVAQEELPSLAGWALRRGSLHFHRHGSHVGRFGWLGEITSAQAWLRVRRRRQQSSGCCRPDDSKGPRMPSRPGLERQ